MEEVIPKILITGVNSGLGKYLHQNINSIGLNRLNATALFKENSHYDYIIHCAFSKAASTFDKSNSELLADLLKLHSKHFIFISSSDVYGNRSQKCSENEILKFEESFTEYTKQKIQAEFEIKKKVEKFLILRPTGLIGPQAMSPNLFKLINEDQPQLTLTENSRLSFVLYDEVLDFIKLYLNKSVSDGIYNISRIDSISISEIAALFNRHPKYGQHHYEVTNLDISKALHHLPSLKIQNKDLLRSLKK